VKAEEINEFPDNNWPPMLMQETNPVQEAIISYYRQVLSQVQHGLIQLEMLRTLQEGITF
jgi:hypothetical protein